METEFLRKWFVYEDSGTLRCLLPGRDAYPWLPIGSNMAYLSGNFGIKKYYLHHLVWQYHQGDIPRRIDHHDRDTKNNRIGNLRICTRSQNQYNSKRKKNNRSGFKGVVSRPGCKTKPWLAKITVNYKIIIIGAYATAEEAGAAYWIAAQQYAGEFARKE